MDFQAALDCLKEGKTIQRRQEILTYKLEDGHVWVVNSNGLTKLPHAVPSIDIEDILAEDWVALA
jgi:hypothetical protein